MGWGTQKWPSCSHFGKSFSHYAKDNDPWQFFTMESFNCLNGCVDIGFSCRGANESSWGVIGHFKELSVNIAACFTLTIEHKLVITSIGTYGYKKQRTISKRYFIALIDFPIFLPMTEFGSLPKAHMQWEPSGTCRREKLHFELKYLARNDADAKLEYKLISEEGLSLVWWCQGHTVAYQLSQYQNISW